MNEQQTKRWHDLSAMTVRQLTQVYDRLMRETGRVQIYGQPWPKKSKEEKVSTIMWVEEGPGA